MQKVGIAELKNRLSHYLRFVRAGQSVLVYDRDQPIARIEPVRRAVAASEEDWTAGLEDAGILRAPTAPLPEDWLARRPLVPADAVAALIDERRSGP